MPRSDDTASMPSPGPRPGLADWIDLLGLLRRDEGVRDAELRRRDRAIGARVQASPTRTERWLVAWVAARRAEVGATDDVAGARVADAIRWSATILGIAGLALGGAAALGALSFQPQGRINVVAVLGVLVGVPTIFLALALLNALPPRWRSVLPLIGPEPEGGGWLQPARWALRALPAHVRERIASVFGKGRAIERLAAPVQRWLLLSLSQSAAVAFQLGALATTLSLVVFSDLSFGWSTTLDIDPAAAHRVTTVLSAPWAWCCPEAVPSIDLIERTRFFRISSHPAPGVAPELYGRWWRFVVAALCFYGLLPRLGLLAFVRARLRRGLSRAMLDAPGARRLLRRMQDPLVETLGMNTDDLTSLRADTSPSGASEPTGDSTPWPLEAVVINWAEALPADLAPASPPEASMPLAAGGRRTPRDDLAVAAEAAALATQHDRPVALVVRAFEPPMLEIVDFLAELRRRLGDGREIIVGLAHSDAGSERVWRRRLASTGDPWLRCTTFAPGASSPAADEGSRDD